MLTVLAERPALTASAFVIVFCITRWNLVPSDRKRTELVMAIGLLCTVITPVALTFALDLLSRLRTARYDLYVDQLDRLIGSPSFALGRLVVRHRWMVFPLVIVYNYLFFMVALVLSLYLYRVPRELPVAIKALVLNVGLAPIIYFALPISGPAYTFHDFPFQSVQPMTAHVIYSRAIPNGMPSVHMSTALLICSLMWRWPLWRLLSVVYIGLTIVSTLATGEHYVLDLVAAIPYWAMVLTLARSPLIGGEPSMGSP